MNVLAMVALGLGSILASASEFQLSVLSQGKAYKVKGIKNPRLWDLRLDFPSHRVSVPEIVSAFPMEQLQASCRDLLPELVEKHESAWWQGTKNRIEAQLNEYRATLRWDVVESPRDTSTFMADLQRLLDQQSLSEMGAFYSSPLKATAKRVSVQQSVDSASLIVRGSGLQRILSRALVGQTLNLKQRTEHEISIAGLDIICDLLEERLSLVLGYQIQEGAKKNRTLHLEEQAVKKIVEELGTKVFATQNPELLQGQALSRLWSEQEWNFEMPRFNERLLALRKELFSERSEALKKQRILETYLDLQAQDVFSELIVEIKNMQTPRDNTSFGERE